MIYVLGIYAKKNVGTARAFVINRSNYVNSTVSNISILFYLSSLHTCKQGRAKLKVLQLPVDTAMWYFF